jgi:NitT/TauT family transport system ATP-binding protein
LSAAAITLRGVAKTFDNGTPALQPTDVTITAGSFVALVGPSGCGKSTLLRLIAGLLTPSAGDVARNSAQIGFVFQDPTLMPWATAAKNVALPLRLARTAGADTRASEALDHVGLHGFCGSYPHQLSGGMQMRVSIARAIVTQPELLLMDEPFAALDEFTRFKLNDDLRALWLKHRWTAVFVTHSIREAVFLSERVLVMSPRPGKIVADVAVDLPAARDETLRLSQAFTEQCARISTVLSAGMREAAA